MSTDQANLIATKLLAWADDEAQRPARNCCSKAIETWLREAAQEALAEPAMTYGPPYIDIRRVGRLKHEILMRDDRIEWITYVAGVAYGRRRAERKARRILRRYLRERARQAEPVTRIHATDLH